MASRSSGQIGSDPHAAADGRIAECELDPLRAYRIPDVCKATGLGRTSIYAAIRSGELVARKWHRCTVVLGHDLAAFMDNLPKVRDGGAIERTNKEVTASPRTKVRRQLIRQ